MARRDSNGAKHESTENEKPTTKRPPTSGDVARLAGVSQSTVSLVLNNVGNNRFSEETRQRVLEASEQLGYVPDAMARSLRAGRSNLVILPFFDWPFNPNSIEFLQTTATRLDELGYTVMLQVTRARPIMVAVQIWASLRPLGVLVEGETLTREAVEVLRRAGVQGILAMGGTPSKFVPTALNSFVPMGRLAGEYLVDKGHRHIGVIVPRDRRILRIGLERLQGIAEVGRPRGVQVERVDLDYDIAEVQQLVQRWRKGPRPTAVFTYNDEYGMLLMRILQDAGFRIPDDLALVGCDNLPIDELMRPRLTSVLIGPADSDGSGIAELLDGLIRGTVGEDSVRFLSKPQLIIRESS